MPRFSDPIELLTLPVADADWAYQQHGKARFFLTNVTEVFKDCSLSANRSRDFIESSGTLLEASGWISKYSDHFDWSTLAKTQFDRLTKDEGPYLFEKACRIVLAIEAAAAKEKPGYDIYQHLRIIPAVFLIDEFTPEALDELRGLDPQFDNKALDALGQRKTRDVAGNVLSQLSKGRRVTAFVAKRLVDYVKSNHPTVNIGKLVYRDIDQNLFGNHHAATGLKTPSVLPLDAIEAERAAIEQMGVFPSAPSQRPSENPAL